MEETIVKTDSSSYFDLQSLLENPVRFGPCFIDPLGHWDTLYTPINIIESSNNTATDGQTVRSFESAQLKDSGSPIARPSIVLFSSDQLSHNWTSIRPSAPGLINVGNTCYLNSVLQVLSHVPPFVQYLLSGHHSSQCQMNSCVFCKIEEHVAQCYPSDVNRPVPAFKPLHIVGALKWISKRFQPYRQEDAHEFLRCLLGEMQRSCIYPYKDLDFASQETTVIYKIFGGYLRQQIKCLKCNNISNTYPVYLDLSLDLMGTSIEEALAMYVREEKLTQSNRYKCEKCEILVDFQKKSTIYILPPILTLHLKRFSFNKAFKMSKITRSIRYGETLEMTSYMSQKKQNPIIYDLIGIIVHSGNDTRCGHYYSFCKTSNGTWQHFNDDRVSTVSLQTVLKQQAYILLYSRSNSSKYTDFNQFSNMHFSLNSLDKIRIHKQNHNSKKEDTGVLV
ncbi:hypothetical protein T552_03046 [Pneumocystis carinii B80]|uniref:Ubiquitin carboxyl-terminal hydrolase n=1 Tax=Pneumocystis carinii (strain B80) TaxID=1408658 RepID=A0A0W4ZCV0_PNEC8|nr:hypothetical protein T552_03046 [Pneumocystis carinii B80]KTW26154.1 hypothetical protein T552_03046 [Pneumocystis carinii B80]